jgi:hypothetical protein
MYTTKNIISGKRYRVPLKMTISPDDLRSNLQQRYDAGESLRTIARTFGGTITHGDIARVLQGVFPAGAGKRDALGIPPVCSTCYQALPKPPREVPAWLDAAVGSLRQLETVANVPLGKKRVYGRGGKRVDIAGNKRGTLIGDSSSLY